MEILKVKNKINKRIEKIIKDGGVLVFPTDTVYGLICDATNRKAVERVFKIKERQKNKPVPIFVKDLKMAKNLVIIPKKQEEFFKKTWPGKVTIVLKRKKTRIKIYGVDKKTIALRIPNYGLVNILLDKLKKPLVGTSANISGKAASGNIREVTRQFENKNYQPDLLIDGGILSGKPSVILDLTVSPPKILRN